jgi:hypothetical protein
MDPDNMQPYTSSRLSIVLEFDHFFCRPVWSLLAYNKKSKWEMLLNVSKTVPVKSYTGTVTNFSFAVPENSMGATSIYFSCSLV